MALYRYRGQRPIHVQGEVIKTGDVVDIVGGTEADLDLRVWERVSNKKSFDQKFEMGKGHQAKVTEFHMRRKTGNAKP